MKMSQEDLASLKEAIRKQKGGGGADDTGFVEVSPAHRLLKASEGCHQTAKQRIPPPGKTKACPQSLLHCCGSSHSVMSRPC